MSLPKWIKSKELPCSYCGQNLNLPARATEALSIAWEALEYGFNGRTVKQPGMSVQARPLSKSEIQISLEKAMRRIEELGK